jgi:subtilisin family serine protease
MMHFFAFISRRIRLVALVACAVACVASSLPRSVAAQSAAAPVPPPAPPVPTSSMAPPTVPASPATNLAPTAATVKKPVNSAADLPQFTYPIDGTASALVQADPATFAAFAAKVGANIDSVLAGYDIRDHATLRELLTTKLQLQMLSGSQDAAAMQTLLQIRSLEDKPDAKLISNVRNQAVIEARAQAGASSGAAFQAAFQQHYHDALAKLPWSIVGTTLKESKSTYEIITPALVLGQVQGSIDPAVAKNHALSSDTAEAVIGSRFALLDVIPIKDQALAVIAPIVAANNTSKPDIWAAREVTLTARDHPTPVRVAVWDSGSDVTLFPNQVWTDPTPGAANPHGFAYDLLSRPTHGYLYPLTPAQRQAFPGFIDDLTGLSDLQSSVDSPAATELRKKITSLSPAEVSGFLENLDLSGIYSHGTHVAGITLRGNPAARLVVGRITFDYKTIPTAPTEALSRAAAASERAAVAYFKAHGVRVVNMSWGNSPADEESALEKNGIGKDATDRKALAHKIFAIERDGLYAALKNAPGILFVCSAGNSDADTDFDETIPAGFVLPNLLVVGAVDQAGDETSFTSYGKNVTVDADGYHVLSYVPGGRKVELSGTSMASPNTANLAAKLIALDPKLTPVETIALIRAGATPSADGRRHLIDPKASVALLKKKMAGSTAAMR